VLERIVAEGRLVASTDPAIVGTAANVVVVIGTPVDEHLNPDQTAIPRALGVCSEHFGDGQLLVLRSTVYPGGADDHDHVGPRFCRRSPGRWRPPAGHRPRSARAPGRPRARRTAAGLRLTSSTASALVS